MTVLLFSAFLALAAASRLPSIESEALGSPEVSTRREAVVPGHSSLGSLKVFTLTASQEGACEQVIPKLKGLANEELRRGGDETEAASMLADVDRESGEEVLKEMIDMLGKANLTDAMKQGEVVTVADMDAMIECETGEKAHLEEEEKTVDGESLDQGDMLLLDDLSSAALLEGGLAWAGTLWSDRRVQYCFHPDASDEMRTAVTAAVAHITKQVPCLEFIDVGAKGESCARLPAVQFSGRDQKRCFAQVGMGGKDKPTPLNLGDRCLNLGTVVHEMLHTLGMLHEQSRSDRDEFVKVHFDNIREGTKFNFKKIGSAYTGDQYDAYSIMHYSSISFSKNGYPTITSRDGKSPKLTGVIGQRQGMSENDVRQLGEMYGCPVYPQLLTSKLSASLIGEGFERPTLPPPGPEGFNGQIKIVIRRAVGLQLKRLFVSHTPDAYVNIYHGDLKVKTHFEKGSKDPEWNQPFVLDYNPDEEIILLKIKDHSGFKPLHGKVIAEAAIMKDMFFPSGHCNGPDGCMLPLANDGEDSEDAPKLDICVGICTKKGCDCS